MTHWYGWLALAVALAFAGWDSVLLVVWAWRGRVSPYAPVWIAAWIAVAAVLVAS